MQSAESHPSTQHPALSTVAFLLIALSAAAQYVPPVPKTIGGRSSITRRTDIPLPPPKQQWVRARSAHFLAISGAGERRTREILTELETVASALRQVDPHLAAEGEQTRVILFARTREAAPYFDLLLARARSPGAFVQSPDGSGTMLIDSSWNFADRTVFHELVHNLLAKSGTRLPLWLEEGLSEYFSTAEVMDRSVRIGRGIREHLYALRNRPLIPVKDLFLADASASIGTTPFFYSESWAVVDWMMRTNRDSFFAFLSDVDHGMSSADALRMRFDIDPAVIERSLNGPELRPAAILTIRLAARPETPVTEPLDHSSALIELATFLGSFAATRSDAERFLSSILSTDPKNGRAVAEIGRLRARDRRYDEATRLFEQAMQLAPGDGEIDLLFAESLLGNALGPFSGTVDIDAGAAPRFQRARQLATAALALGADAARANAVIGTSYLVESDVRPGIEALQRAREARPGRYDIALNLYALLLRGGDREAADRLYNEISTRARTPQAILAVRAVFVRERLALTNRLLAENRIEDAMAIVQQLIDVTPDAAAKMDLQRQLMHLRDVGDANRQIRTYNEAVEAANRGDTRQALTILDRLLSIATDPAVIRDATALREQMQKRLKGMRRSRYVIPSREDGEESGRGDARLSPTQVPRSRSE